MKTHNDNNAVSSQRSPLRRRIAAAVLVAAVGAMAVAGATSAGTGPLGHHGHHGQMAMDPAAMDQHIDQMVQKVLAESTPAQKAKVAAIAKAAIADLRPAHQQFALAHARAHELLMAPVIDRGALERLRADQMIQMEFVSRRIVTAMADIAEVLPPEQRAKVAGHLRAFMH